MNDEMLMEIAARSNPVPDDAFRRIETSEWARETLSEILATPLRRAERWVRTVAVAGAAAALVGVLVAVLATEPTEQRRGSEPAPGAARMAQESPHLLLGADGWEVVDASESGGRVGEMTFDNGRSCMDADAAPGCYWVSLNWYPRESYEDYLADRRRGADGSWEVTIDGHAATVFRAATAPAGMKTFYALWVDGDHWLELRSDVILTVDEFLEVARTLHSVDADTWVAALPERLVTPDERSAAIERALQGLPLPPSLDVGTLEVDGGIREPYDVNWAVATAVACAWIDHWAAADGPDEAQEAVDALSGARHWPAFIDGNMQGEYVTDVASAMRGGEPLRGVRSLSVADGYRRHLGCEEEG